MLSDNTKSHLHLNFIVLIWGFTAILGALISLDSLPLVWYRMLFAVGFIYVYFILTQETIRIAPRKALSFIFCGCIIALHWFTFFRAIKISNVSITLACLSTGAFFTALLEPLMYGKKVVWYEVVFGLMVVLGLYIIFRVEVNHWEGMITALISAFLSALFAVINSKLVQEYKPALLSFYELLGGVLFFSVILFLNGSFKSDFFQIKLQDFLYLLVLSSICTAYAMIVSTGVMRYLSPYTVMLTINLEPLYGILLAVFIFEEKEKMSFPFYLGAFLIIMTVVCNGIIKARTQQK